MKKKAGFSLVEVLVMTFIATFAIFIVWKIYIIYIKISLSDPATFQASFLAEEGIEAVKFMRDNSWSSNIATLSTNTPYTLTFDGTVWGVTTTPAFISNKFDRRIYFFDVVRDVSGNISSSGSSDPNTKRVSVVISWQKNMSTTTHDLTTYVSNILNN